VSATELLPPQLMWMNTFSVVNGSTINNGAGSGSTKLESSNTNVNANSNSNHNTNTNVNSNTAHANSSSVSVAAGGSARQHQSQNQSQSVDGSGNSSNSYVQEAQKRDPVSTAFAAPLVASGDCMGSSSAGGQGVGFGLSLGTTWKDNDCERRYKAVTLHNFGKHKAAIKLLCNDPEIAAAMEADGGCPMMDGQPSHFGELSPAEGHMAPRDNGFPAQPRR
jgi:hypothetical protein